MQDYSAVVFLASLLLGYVFLVADVNNRASSSSSSAGLIV